MTVLKHIIQKQLWMTVLKHIHKLGIISRLGPTGPTLPPPDDKQSIRLIIGGDTSSILGQSNTPTDPYASSPKKNTEIQTGNDY